MLWIFLLVVTVVWVLQRSRMSKRQAALTNQLKTNLKTYPMFGHTLMMLGTNEGRMKAMQAFGRDAIEFGGISKILYCNELIVCVADPAVAEVVLTRCLEKHYIFKVLEFLIGNASIIAPVHIWRLRRKLNAPFFSTKNLVLFSKTFAEQSIALADTLEKHTNRETFSIWKYIQAYSMSTVCENTMGVKIDAEGRKFSNALEEMWKFWTSLVCQPWLKAIMPLLPCYSKACENRITMWKFITKIFQEKRKKMESKTNQTSVPENKDKKYSFLDHQLDDTGNNLKFTEQELFEEALMLVGAGYDTTATTAAFVILMMSRYLDIQHKVHEELQDVFGGSDRPVVFEDLNRLRYLDAVIKETLRLCPLVPVIVRQVEKDVTLPSGVTIVKDCGILVNIWAIHRNPAYWGEDADQFRPERFLDYTPKHPAAFMPFSYGPRNCLGYRYAMISLTIVVSTLLRRYRVLPPPGVAQGEQLRTKFDMMLRHVDNYEIQLERRKLIKIHP